LPLPSPPTPTAFNSAPQPPSPVRPYHHSREREGGKTEEERVRFEAASHWPKPLPLMPRCVHPAALPIPPSSSSLGEADESAPASGPCRTGRQPLPRRSRRIASAGLMQSSPTIPVRRDCWVVSELRARMRPGKALDEHGLESRQPMGSHRLRRNQPGPPPWTLLPPPRPPPPSGTDFLRSEVPRFLLKERNRV